MNRALKVTVGIVSALVGLLMVLAGAGKLFQPDPNLRAFAQFGLASWMVPVIGVAELLGGLLILVPRTSWLGAGIVVVVMFGAIVTHLTSGVGSPFGAGVVLALAMVVGILRWRQSQGTASSSIPVGGE